MEKLRPQARTAARFYIIAAAPYEEQLVMVLLLASCRRRHLPCMGRQAFRLIKRSRT